MITHIIFFSNSSNVYNDSVYDSSDTYHNHKYYYVKDNKTGYCLLDLNLSDMKIEDCWLSDETENLIKMKLKDKE